MWGGTACAGWGCFLPALPSGLSTSLPPHLACPTFRAHALCRVYRMRPWGLTWCVEGSGQRAGVGVGVTDSRTGEEGSPGRSGARSVVGTPRQVGSHVDGGAGSCPGQRAAWMSSLTSLLAKPGEAAESARSRGSVHGWEVVGGFPLDMLGAPGPGMGEAGGSPGSRGSLQGLLLSRQSRLGSRGPAAAGARLLPGGS